MYAASTSAQVGARSRIPDASSELRGYRRMTEVAKSLRLTGRQITAYVYRGSLDARWWNGTLIISERDLARFVASRRTW